MLDSSFLAAPISAHERVGVSLDRLERGLQHAAALIAFRVQATLQAVASGLAGLESPSGPLRGCEPGRKKSVI